MEKVFEHMIEGFSFYPIFFPYYGFFLFSQSSLSPDRTAILETMPRMNFSIVRNDDLRLGEFNLWI